MKICDKCREQTYKNLKSALQVYGECDICGANTNCNEHPDWILIKDEDVLKEDIKNYIIVNV